MGERRLNKLQSTKGDSNMEKVNHHEKRLLLISNSALYGSGYLDHAEKEIRNFLGAVRRVLLLSPIRRRVAEGMPYLGSSAVSIVACPTLKTTKDMPIVEPPSFDALGLVAFQISPHYLDPDPGSAHMGETQEERINQYLEENRAPVIGLREGTMVTGTDDETAMRAFCSPAFNGKLFQHPSVLKLNSD
jgi:peptidase E